jgi:SAM-dependent methyltransferase
MKQAFLLAPTIKENPPRWFPRSRRWLTLVYGRVVKRLPDLVHERGLETSSPYTQLEHYHPDRVWYQPSGWSYLKRALGPSAVESTDVFVDFGSGKGRVLYQAAQYPFARVIGVEISAALNEIAQANIEQNRHRLSCQNVELVTSDAAEYDVPDDVTVAYFYYPFVGETFGRVVENIVASLDRKPRRFRIIYALPLMEDRILETGRFRRVLSRRIVDIGLANRISVYESVPTSR